MVTLGRNEKVGDGHSDRCVITMSSFTRVMWRAVLSSNSRVVGSIQWASSNRKRTGLAAQSELTENRFEDIRRELRERESALRYAVIDLNLAKSDPGGQRDALN